MRRERLAFERDVSIERRNMQIEDWLSGTREHFSALSARPALGDVLGDTLYQAPYWPWRAVLLPAVVGSSSGLWCWSTTQHVGSRTMPKVADADGVAQQLLAISLQPHLIRVSFLVLSVLFAAVIAVAVQRILRGNYRMKIGGVDLTSSDPAVELALDELRNQQAQDNRDSRKLYQWVHDLGTELSKLRAGTPATPNAAPTVPIAQTQQVTAAEDADSADTTGR